MQRNATKPKPVVVWDFPFRICHWGLAVSLSASFYIGYNYNPESRTFKYHMLLGLVAAYFLVVRIILGFLGSRPARWKDFFIAAAGIGRYLFSVLRWRSVRHDGINPGTAIMAIGLYASLTGLIYTGFNLDDAERWHGKIANAVLVLIGIHLLGLILHAAREREWIFLSMIDGRKKATNQSSSLSQRWTAGALLCLVSAGVIGCAYYYFIADSSLLSIPGLPDLMFPIVERG